jgi:hypothetical protein
VFNDGASPPGAAAMAPSASDFAVLVLAARTGTIRDERVATARDRRAIAHTAGRLLHRVEHYAIQLHTQGISVGGKTGLTGGSTHRRMSRRC